jgi:hypothetical protein
MALTVTKLGELAQGTIGEATEPAQAGLTLLDSGKFTRKITDWLFGICGDERCDLHGNRLLLPAGFGAFAALVVTDALTIRKWYQPGMTIAEHTAAAWKDVKAQYPDAKASVHTDAAAKAAADAASDDEVVECGCAAIAKAGVVLGLLVAQADQIDHPDRDKIVANAQELLDGGYAVDNTARTIEELVQQGLALEVLNGLHDGVAIIINRREGTVIDRPALYAACEAAGIPILKAFEYDQWAMRQAAQNFSESGADAERFFAAGDALMMTTIRAIAHPDLAVVVYE